jgi:hypothetical protein
LGEIERVEENGEVTFDVTMTKGETERSFSVGEDGTLLSVEVELAETPIAVRTTIQKQIGTGTLDIIDKTFDNAEITYEVDFTTKDGAERSFTVGVDGKLQSVQVELAEVPAAVKKTVEEHTSKAKLGDIFKTFEDGEVSYEVEMTKEGKVRDFAVAENGKLESQEMFLSELPAPARKTVKEKIGDGKILRIDEVFEKREGVFPFEVEGRKDDKPFNFSVGPKGRFLGMDEYLGRTQRKPASQRPAYCVCLRAMIRSRIFCGAGTPSMRSAASSVAEEEMVTSPMFTMRARKL